MIKMYIGLYVKCRLLLSDFNVTWIFQTDFQKIFNTTNFIKIRLVGAELFHADWRTDMTMLIVAFRYFPNTPDELQSHKQQESYQDHLMKERSWLSWEWAAEWPGSAGRYANRLVSHHFVSTGHETSKQLCCREKG
jgi:hypothetical protein